MDDVFKLSKQGIHINVYTDVKKDEVIWIAGVRLGNSKKCSWTEGEGGKYGMSEYSTAEKAYEAAFKLVDSLRKKWNRD